ncbi:MAG TPA: hypothetical protein VHV75_14485 [Solirubrobacteraceae bacterium]|jgi:hypothetical protein|nr:hypothetical protein [Solirubrobacteraceae bacterium]
MSVQQPQKITGDEPIQTQPDRFTALCSEVEEYEHLPELTAGVHYPTHLITGSHEDALDESILAGLTLP